MEPFDIRLQLAETSTAFAGFSGVVVALGSRNRWDKQARLFRAPIARSFVFSDGANRLTVVVSYAFAVSVGMLLVTQILGICGLAPGAGIFVTGLFVLLFLAARQFAILSIAAIDRSGARAIPSVEVTELTDGD